MHRVYLIPGFFGFARLAGFDYFRHLEAGLQQRFREAGAPLVVEVVPTPPTASIRRRARFLAERIRIHASDSRGPIHLVGHSTGGLDARLLTSPSVHLLTDDGDLAWRERIASVVCLNTPHHGTPLAQFFTGVHGNAMLYALSLLTVTTLSVGGPPLTAATGLLAMLGGVDERLDVGLLDRTADGLLRGLGEDGRDEVRGWLEGVRRDQGAILQLTPEAMDLFAAAAEDAPDVRYACTASASPEPPRSWRPTWLRGGTLSERLSRALYALIHDVTADEPRDYPCPRPSKEAARMLHQRIGKPCTPEMCDGVVPTRSMLHGELVWAGVGDHLDVVGHFGAAAGSEHTDWLASGAHFSRVDFDALLDAVAGFVLR